MKGSFVRLLILAIFGGTFFGCTHITLLRTEEIRRVQSRVDSLQTEIIDLKNQMVKEQKKQTEMLRMIRADQQTGFGELERTASSLVGSFNDNQDRLSRIDEKTQEIKKAWEEKAMSDSLEQMSRSAEIENLFEIARGDFIAGRYDVSLNGFLDIHTRFPESSFAERSYYWVAECNYVMKKYRNAEKLLKDYIKLYKEGSKICVALFKLGLVYEKTNKKSSRTIVWKKLLSQCPQSEEADIVNVRLEKEQ